MTEMMRNEGSSDAPVLRFGVRSPRRPGDFLRAFNLAEHAHARSPDDVETLYSAVDAFIGWVTSMREYRGSVSLLTPGIQTAYVRLHTALAVLKDQDPLARAYYARLLECRAHFIGNEGIVADALSEAGRAEGEARQQGIEAEMARRGTEITAAIRERIGAQEEAAMRFM